MRLNDVATLAGIIEIVLHIELDSEVARRTRPGKALVAQQTGWTRGVASNARVRVELFVTRLFVAFEAIITRVPRRSVPQETRILKTVLPCWMLALIGNIMASRADHLFIFQKRGKFLAQIQLADSDVGCMPARQCSSTITMTSCAQCLGVTFVQTDIAGDRRGIDVAGLAGVLIPVRIILRQCITAEH